ncbi:helix-turn-helix transcriptional regulator [Zunongwangia endophytica]|uniref:Helix-turn-helix transcriptional regulator n=1 Tax=Zunongwangia endophytica TaxID=1808945 RepID=A0ABV8H505_9FLAO|nr:LuxR C-terminal-related transcriptional regulator [Zunongwangia endophytica]MDN3595291.1 LuxR C-terminal-related transcriptional regulator [Zunongwangia endophytica]
MRRKWVKIKVILKDRLSYADRLMILAVIAFVILTTIATVMIYDINKKPEAGTTGFSHKYLRLNKYQMKVKTTKPNENAQHLIAGLLQKDDGIEFYGIPQSKRVEWLQNGHSQNFQNLPRDKFMILANAFNSNNEAREVINKYFGIHLPFKRRVELYTYFMYGGLDNKPDLIGEVLQPPENYRHEENCISLQFKKIHLNGSPLKDREIRMLDMMLRDYKDTAIAFKMGIQVSTYNQHKKELFIKTGTHSRTSLMIAAIKQRATGFFHKVSFS